MLERLGFRHFAYDWRDEHVATFDAEIEALKRHAIALDAFWCPGELNPASRRILDLLTRHGIKAQLWVIQNLGADVGPIPGPERERRIAAAVAKLQPLADEAKKAGCSVALYNHGGWFGEPENQIAIIEYLRREGIANVGIVYNLHHGHDHLDRFGTLLTKMLPYLWALNLNGMEQNGDKFGKKLLPLGQGSLDLDLLRTIRDSGYHGPIGILGHTQDDAEDRLRDNLDGLDWLVAQLDGKPPGPKPTPRTLKTYRAVSLSTAAPAYAPAIVAKLIAEARHLGDATRGATVFADATLACLSCHKVGGQGGVIGPDLSNIGQNLTPDQIVESVLWPSREVKPGYGALAIATTDGKQIQGYEEPGAAGDLTIRLATSGEKIRLPRTDIEEVHMTGTLMPAGLIVNLTDERRNDLFRFLFDLGRASAASTGAMAMLGHSHSPASFPYSRRPIHPKLWPHHEHPVNRDRVYDFYAKEAAYYRAQPTLPAVLPAYPGLDGGTLGHWGNQNDTTWTDGRWNETDLGSLISGVFRGAGVTVPKGVCVRLGDHGELAACFNPETLCYEAVWQGGFVKFAPLRHGFLGGLILDGKPIPDPIGQAKPEMPFQYRGFYRSGNRVVFAYRIGDTEMLDAPWVEDGKFTHLVGPADKHPLAALTRGGPAQWPQVLETRGTLGNGSPYALDTIEPPFQNPWKSLLFFGDHDFLPDGTAFLCTMQGDVWRVDGLDDSLASVRWRRVASGLHHALGLVVTDGHVHVLGRDQITRLHDLNGDGEMDFYECVSNNYTTSPAGHDFIAGLQRDASGRFYTVSGKQGLLRIAPDGARVEVLATGFRNPDGLGLSPSGLITIPNSEGEWVPASMICEVRPGGFYGYGGPRQNQPPDLPLAYLARGLDNSSGSQVTVTSDRWGPLNGQLLHFSYGAGTHFLVLREQVNDQAQGAVVPLPGDFRSGVHRGRFNLKDGQLYVSGMAGWGTYTPDDGCFQRVRYTGDPVQIPVAFHMHENGILVTFARPLDRAIAGDPKNQFAQAWNYRYGAAYGSPELSPRHPGTSGHDSLAITSATVLGDGRTLFLELPEIQPVNQLHLHLKVDPGPPRDLFVTVHKLAGPFTGFPGYRPTVKTIAAHPILTDLARTANSPPNPWKKPIPGARTVRIEAGKDLSFSVQSFNVRAGEPIKLAFGNPDVVPHNWALIKPGSLPRVGDLVNKIIADPEAVFRHYIPRTDDVLVYTDMVFPQQAFSLFFRAPSEPGRYPFLCTFPGHWMVMNGVMVVE